MAEDHGQRAKHRKRHRGEEQDAMLEFAVKIRRQRHGGCDRQQVDGGDPLHSSSVHVEFPHELWEQHRHHGFGEDADEGERADRHDGADEFAGNAFVRRSFIITFRALFPAAMCDAAIDAWALQSKQASTPAKNSSGTPDPMPAGNEHQALRWPERPSPLSSSSCRIFRIRSNLGLTSCS